VIVAPGELRPVQALLRWQPRWHADRELDERRALHLPPAGRMAALTGDARAIAEFLASVELPPAAEVLGPVPVVVPRSTDAETAERMLVRVPRVQGAALATALKAGQAMRSARKAPSVVRVELDPATLG
jgi:primosomal protein N' (replication factor Y)